VLSAIEGLKVINPGFEGYVVPLTLAVLATLFAVQFRGTSGVAKFFAPVTTLWFIVIAITGLAHILHDPEILYAFNPAYGLVILSHHPGVALLIMGGVFLAVTGGEALYADMGHFGKTPIRLAWLCVGRSITPARRLSAYAGRSRQLGRRVSSARPRWPPGVPIRAGVVENGGRFLYRPLAGDHLSGVGARHQPGHAWLSGGAHDHG
jgi:hypothetical protein